MQRQMRTGTILLASCAYVVAGTGAAMLAGEASSAAAVQGWRLVSWLLSLAVFVVHFAIERGRQSRRPSVAWQVALAVAVGALGVAALGPIRMHWSEPHRLRLVALSLIAWPVITGVPAFAVAWLGGFVLDHARSRGHTSRSR